MIIVAILSLIFLEVLVFLAIVCGIHAYLNENEILLPSILAHTGGCTFDLYQDTLNFIQLNK